MMVQCMNKEKKHVHDLVIIVRKEGDRDTLFARTASTSCKSRDTLAPIPRHTFLGDQSKKRFYLPIR